jgi:hypothetical protein
MNRTKLLALIVVVLSVVIGLTACDEYQEQGPDYARVCVDRITHQRVPGYKCGTSDIHPFSGFAWYYFPYGHVLPPYGYPVSGGRYSIRKSALVAHDELLAPRGGKSYTKAKTVPYSTGGGKKLGTSSGSGYKVKAPAVKAPNVKAPANKAPAPVVKAPAPVYKAPPPAIRTK